MLSWSHWSPHFALRRLVESVVRNELTDEAQGKFLAITKYENGKSILKKGRLTRTGFFSAQASRNSSFDYSLDQSKLGSWLLLGNENCLHMKESLVSFACPSNFPSFHGISQFHLPKRIVCCKSSQLCQKHVWIDIIRPCYLALALMSRYLGISQISSQSKKITGETSCSGFTPSGWKKTHRHSSSAPSRPVSPSLRTSSPPFEALVVYWFDAFATPL